MKVFSNSRFRIYIYENDHPPPHCHVRFADESDVCVTLPLVEPMYGAIINREIRAIIENNIETLTEIWEKFHPKRTKNDRNQKSDKPFRRK